MATNSFKLLSKKTIASICIPLFVLLTQLFFKWYTGSDDYKHIGTSLAATGLSQMFPFIMWEHLIATKLVMMSTEFIQTKKSHRFTYKMTPIDKTQAEIERINYLTLILFIVNLLIFIITVALGCKEGYSWQNNILGLLSVTISIAYLIKV